MEKPYNINTLISNLKNKNFSFEDYTNFIEKMLLEVNIDKQNKDGDTALLIASWYDAEIAEDLLNRGANPNISEKYKNSPIIYASQKNPQIIKNLIDKGADVNHKNSDKNTALLFASKYNPEYINMLIDKGADVNAINNFKMTPLLMAARYNPKYVDVLIKNGADVNIKSEKGKIYSDLINDHGNNRPRM